METETASEALMVCMIMKLQQQWHFIPDHFVASQSCHLIRLSQKYPRKLHNRLRLPPFWFHCEGDYWPSYTLYFCHLICIAQKYPRRLHNRLRLPPFWFHCEGDYWPSYSYIHYTRVLSRHSAYKNLPWPERSCNTTNNKESKHHSSLQWTPCLPCPLNMPTPSIHTASHASSAF